MALFFQGNKPAVEWDGKKNKAKFQFVKRFLDTNDPRLIKLLTDLEYERVDEERLTKGVHTKSGNVRGASTAAPLSPSKTTNPSPIDRVRRRKPPKE